MRFIAIMLIFLSGCQVTEPSRYKSKKLQLEQDINLLKLEIRKGRLEKTLEEVEQ